MAPPNQIAVLNPLLIGIATTFCTIILHALLLGTIIWIVRRDLRLGRVGTRFWLDTIFITNVAMLLLTAHLAEIGLWALVLERCGEFSNFGAAYYHSAVNYTTLGDSAFAMSARWRLLAALEAGAIVEGKSFEGNLAYVTARGPASLLNRYRRFRERT